MNLFDSRLANILFTDQTSDEIKIIDFGLSRVGIFFDSTINQPRSMYVIIYIVY